MSKIANQPTSRVFVTGIDVDGLPNHGIPRPYSKPSPAAAKLAFGKAENTIPAGKCRAADPPGSHSGRSDVEREQSRVAGRGGFAINKHVRTTTSMNRVSVENPDDHDDRIYLTRPVTPLRLSPLLGIKPHVMLAELMKRNVFLQLREIVSDSDAKEIARTYHRVLIIRDKDPEA